MKLFGFDIGYGNSFKDKLYWLVTGFMTKQGFMLWGGDAPAPAPTTNTSYTTNIPDYAKPYVGNMLNAAQAQIFNPSMTGFNAYTPYSNDPRSYVAGFSPMQQQAFSSAANMQVPGQYGAATLGTLGGMAGLGGVGSAMGRAGYDYSRMATDPRAIGAYMNPYLSASLAPQLQLANQQYGIAGQEGQSKATQQGAFGGAREALMAGQNAQNQMLAQNQLIGQGYNKAFDTAQQAQQFGANLGLQGQQGQLAALQAYLGGANQLAGIGGAQLGAEQGITNLQNQFGGQQQANQQNVINQAVQNYATAQQYPFMQLGLMNSMLRGLPMQQSSTQMYQAPPNPLTQAAGLAATGYGLLNKKEGGVIKAASGIPISHYSNDQLNKVQQSPSASPLEKVVAMGELGLHNYITANPEAKNVISRPLQQPSQMPPPQQMAMMPQNRVGLGAVGTGEMVPTVGAAGGGLLAFVGGGDTSTDGTDKTVYPPTPGPDSMQSGIDPMTASSDTLIRQALMGSRPESDAAKAQREAIEEGISKREKSKESDKWTQLGLNLLKQTGPFAGVNLGNAGAETLDYLSKQEGLNDADRKELLKLSVEQDKNELTRNDQMLTNLNTVEANKATKMYQIESLKIQKQAQENDKLLKSTQDAGKLWTDTLSKNLLNARTNAARTNTDISEAEAYRQAYEDTYNMMKDLPNFKLLGNMPEPEKAPTPIPPPPKEPGLIDKIKSAFGGSKVVNFDAQGNRIP